jgi:hypothetical protein
MIEQAKKMGTGMWICVGLIGVGLIGVAVVALAVGLSGSWIILPLIGCVAMMGMMMWMMMRGMGHSGSQN